MKERLTLWLADAMWDALRLLAGWLHDWVFSEERAARLRMKKREWWWARTEKAKTTKSPRDDMRARFWQILDAFETPPSEAVARGDLDPASRRAAMDAVETNRVTTAHGNHP